MFPKITRVGNTDPRGVASISTEISRGQIRQQQVEGQWGGQHECHKDHGRVYIKKKKVVNGSLPVKSPMYKLGEKDKIKSLSPPQCGGFLLSVYISLL